MKRSIIPAVVMVIIATAISFGQNQIPKSKNDKKCDMKCCDEAGKGSSSGKCKVELGELIKSSLKMKDAFVSSSASQVSESAGEVLVSLGKIEMSGMKGEEHEECQKLLKSMSQNLNNIKDSKNIDTQRTEFAAYNETLYESIKHFGFKGEKLYYDFCPMALNSKGAFWLSNTEEIRNPYFGDRMLGCGKVKETIE
jgi:Cu(I)/Ag(I) efflux system membrane fusion protein